LGADAQAEQAASVEPSIKVILTIKKYNECLTNMNIELGRRPGKGKPDIHLCQVLSDGSDDVSILSLNWKRWQTELIKMQQK